MDWAMTFEEWWADGLAASHDADEKFLAGLAWDVAIEAAAQRSRVSEFPDGLSIADEIRALKCKP